jgi:hypothetical protein
VTWIEVRITDSKGSLVDEFDTNSTGFADQRIKDWGAKFKTFEPDEVLAIKRSDQPQDGGSQ